MLAIILSFILFLFSSQSSYAYTLKEVSNHNSSSDCWVVFKGNVYDLTSYLRNHDKYLDIRKWCGTDITEAYTTRAGEGDDHSTSAYALLQQYLIGSIDNQTVTGVIPVVNSEELEEEDDEEENEDVQLVSDLKSDEKIVNANPYNIIIPLLLTLTLYWIPYSIIKIGKKFTYLKTFNAFWNTLLLFLLLIPALGFGIFMILRYKFDGLWNINFDFMYWHVELSLVMGLLGISHFLQRIGVYFSQLKKRVIS